MLPFKDQNVIISWTDLFLPKTNQNCCQTVEYDKRQSAGDPVEDLFDKEVVVSTIELTKEWLQSRLLIAFF